MKPLLPCLALLAFGLTAAGAETAEAPMSVTPSGSPRIRAGTQLRPCP